MSTALVSLSSRFQCDFHDKEHRGSLMYPARYLSRSLSQSTHSGSVSISWLFLFLLVLVSLSFLSLPGFPRVVFVLLVEGWFLPRPVWLVKTVGDSSAEGLFLDTVFRESLWRWSWLDFTKVVPDGQMDSRRLSGPTGRSKH